MSNCRMFKVANNSCVANCLIDISVGTCVMPRCARSNSGIEGACALISEHGCGNEAGWRLRTTTFEYGFFN